MPEPINAPIYQIKVTLLRSDPPIWRRLLVSSETRLDRMHDGSAVGNGG